MNDKQNLSIKDTFNLAIQNHQKNKLNVAQDLYNQILKIDPGHVSTLNNLGVIFRELGELQKAKSCYEKAIEINPNYTDAHNNLGGVFKELGEHQKAKSYFEKAIEINPDHINAHFNLGVIFKELGEIQKAKSCYEKTIEINPNYINAHNNLGVVFKELGEYQKAKGCYEKAIEIDPNNINLTNNLSFLLREFIFYAETETDQADLKKLYLFLFKKNNIKHTSIIHGAKSLLFSSNDQNQLLEVINSGSLLSGKILQKILKDELFHLMLQKSLIIDVFLEKLLTKLRCELLFILDDLNKNILKENFDFIISLAEQSWLNEYVYIQSEKEINYINKLKNKVENSIEVDELEITILGCYTPLNASKIITEKLFNYKSTNILFKDLINIQIKEPLKEIELSKSIKSFGIIDDLVSKKVREQYEENPYPRWRYIYKRPQTSFLKEIEQELRPNKIIYNNKFNNPNVLIAGCGTGSHSIQATKYQNASILAVDLSKSSLAYAKRKTEELSLKNIEYLHADILQLKKLNKKFDIIESSGVLVCMKNPIAGLKVLVDILEPHGFLKLGLYSEIARRHVVNARDLIKKQKLKNTNEDIKNFRQDILNKRVDPLIQNVTNYLDFYSTSNVRDLLFHVQEHRFTLPEISKILKDLNLEFLGFLNSDPYIKEKYLKYFPEDKKNISLDNWHQFEINNPDIFLGMYQFWVRKI